MNSVNIYSILQSYDRLYLRLPNINIGIYGKITGNVPRDRFIDAVEQVSKRHPLAKTAIGIDEENRAWFVECKEPINIDLIADKDGIDLKSWYLQADSEPFDLERGPLLRIGVSFATDHTEIILLGHHAIGDANGYLNLLKDLLLILDGRADEKPQIPPQNNSIKTNMKFSMLENLYAKHMNDTWRAKKRVFSQSEYLDMFHGFRENYPPGIFLASLRGKELTAMLSKCKELDITVNDAVTTAFTAAAQKTINNGENEQMRLAVVVSYRSELVHPAPDCMGNYATGIGVEAKYDYSKSFSENALRLNGMLKEKLEKHETRYQQVCYIQKLDSNYIEAIAYSSCDHYDDSETKQLGELIGFKKNRNHVGITNLGRYQPIEFNDFKLVELLFIPPVFQSTVLTVGLITLNDTLGLCLRYAKSMVSDETAERIATEAINYLGFSN
jgi:NRPS condensation-like uncharacterized protein